MPTAKRKLATERLDKIVDQYVSGSGDFFSYRILDGMVILEIDGEFSTQELTRLANAAKHLQNALNLEREMNMKKLPGF
jgi:hypothetical protein